MEKNVLVAGGAGFIGSHLCDRLIADGCHVTCLDNLYTGSIGNIGHLLQHPRFSFVQHDVARPYQATNVTAIVNLACPASPRHYQKDAIYTTKTAVIGTMHMLDLARQNKCPILQASTSEVYGDPLIHPQPETYKGNVNPIGIRSCYDEGKRCAESLCMDYYHWISHIRCLYDILSIQRTDTTLFGTNKQPATMIVLDFLLYSSYCFFDAIRGQAPKSLATCNVSFVFSFHLTYLSELIAKYAFGLRLQDFINVAVGTMIAFYIILILLYMRTRRNNCGYDNMEEKFKTRSFHKTSLYVLVTLGIGIWTILLGIFLYTYVI